MKQLTALITVCLCLFSSLAAHAAGANFFEQGLMHPMMVPTQLIALFALGLLLGQQGWRHIRIVLPAFLVVISAALFMTRFQTASWDPEMVLLPLAGITGLILTLKRELFLTVSLVIAVVVAVVIGMDSAIPMIPGLQTRKIYAGLAGTGLSVFGLLAIVTLIAYGLRNVIQGIVLRILGAWSAAGAVLVLTLLLANVART